MCTVIRHRGPDDQGTLIKDGIALGMRRLSIIDLSGGHQPMSGEDGTVSVVFNGEIYNYRDLRPLLESLGHRFKTDSDTEVIVHAYEQYGADCVRHLRGMFGLAIWDDRNKNLFLARDRVGKKPLYYSLTPQGSLVFGSELKCVIEHPEVNRDVDLNAVDGYLSLGYVPDPLSIFKHISKLPPGHHLTFSNGRITVKQYWDFQFDPLELSAEQDYLEELRSLLDESVRLRLVSDVPLGAFLSGGIDSSVVVGLMSRHLDQPVKTFSIGFREHSYDELDYARMAARHFGTDHTEFILTPDLCQIVDELIWHFDEPFADTSAVPTYVLSKLAREHVTVVLSGDGGDELFAGYTRYVVDRKRNRYVRVPRLVRRRIMQPLSRILPHNTLGRNYLHNVALDPLERYVDSLSVFTSLHKESLYTDGFNSQLKGELSQLPDLKDYASNVTTGEPLDRMLYIDSKSYLPGVILTKVDRMSMAVSLEARAPLLDHKLIEFAVRIPAAIKMKGLETKHVFKSAVADLVPPQVLNRPKQGFDVPVRHWINDQLRELVRDTFSDIRTRTRGYVDPRYVDLLLDEHSRNRRDHSFQLWTLLMLELWHRVFCDSSRRNLFNIADSTSRASKAGRAPSFAAD
jgi:asparagine synthase (glutamine-hydrolysing)